MTGRLFGWAVMLSVLVVAPGVFAIWFLVAVAREMAKKKRRALPAMSVPPRPPNALLGTSPPPGAGIKPWTRVEAYLGSQFLV